MKKIIRGRHYLNVSIFGAKFNWCLSLIVICVFLSGCADTGVVKKKRILLGTIVEISVADLNLERPAKIDAINKAFAEMERLDSLLSTYKEGSDIHRINRFAYVRPVQVELDTIKVILAAKRLYDSTGGAFDVSVGPLVKLWGFDANGELQDIPTEEEIQQALKNVGMNKLRINAAGRKIIFLRQGVKIDLSAIAKGFAVDKAIEALKGQGVTNAMVNAGGDMFCMGKGPWQKGWKVGIQHPRISSKLLEVVRLEDKAIATSGDYEKFFFWNKKRMSHIIDPRTGRPKADIPAGVTVTAPDCTTADAVATAVFVMGPEQGIKFLEKQKDVDGMIVSVDGTQLNIATTEGFDKG